MHRHLDGLAIVQRPASDQTKIVEAHVLERARHRADIAGILRAVEYERKFVARGHLLVMRVSMPQRKGGKVRIFSEYWVQGSPLQTQRGFHYNKVD